MSGVGEMIASAVVKQITSRLFQLLKDEITLQWKFKGELDKMAEKMKDLEALMHDADDKVSRGGNVGAEVGRWLMKLKSIAHDVEDLLDDLDTQHNQAKLNVIFSRDNKAYRWITKPHNLDSLRKRIGEIEIQGQKFNLSNEPRVVGSRTRETFSIGNGMQGRDTEKDKLISLLFRTEASDISIIPIVGLGGIGKTTLVQSVLEDKRVNSFNIRAWVHVSDIFDLSKIGRAIMSASTGVNLDNGTTLQFLHESLKVQLTGKRYLIVLDDLWEEDGNIMDELKRMLQYGSKGSRIIVTTRNQRVVEKGLRTGVLANIWKICVVPESDQINLGVLSTSDCWELMKMRAFGPDDDQSSLEKIGNEIAGICGGLPLVANALGQVMSEDKSVQAWKDIIKRMMYLGLGANDQVNTLESLKLSYYYMKPDYKMCFTYLAAFPKGFIIDTNRLIRQWNALGYTYLGYNGQTVIKYLLGMSFLQLSGSVPVGLNSVHAKAPQEVTMHDFVHELVSIITAEEFHVMDATEPRKWDKYIHCRHAQLIKYKNQAHVFKHLPGKLRSLHFRSCQELQLPKNAFSGAKYIRILDLSATQNTSGCSIKLPASMDELKLLRYFDATGFPIASLPKSFHTLQNMETLILSNCSLETLPDNIHSLSKLCYLDLSGNKSLNKPPISLAGLPKLIFLNMSGCSKLTKLSDEVSLESLEHLDLSNCHELENLPHDFGNLQNLEFFNLSNCHRVSMLPESFCKLENLKDLDLSDCHGLRELPYSFGNLSKLESLNLGGCSKLHELPESLGTLLKLRLQHLPSSFCNLKLQVLEMSHTSLTSYPEGILNMTTLTKFVFTTSNTVLANQVESIMPLLNLPGWVILCVLEVPNTGYSNIVKLAQLSCPYLHVKCLHNVMSSEDAERAKLQDKLDLLWLTLEWDIEVDTFAVECKYVLEKLLPPRTLERFKLTGYRSKDFPNWMSDISSHLPSLTYIKLSDLAICNLPPLGQLPNLRMLLMKNMPNIQKIGNELYGEGPSFRKLRQLHLESMDNLVEWWTAQSGEENKELAIPILNKLHIFCCPKLKCLPYLPRSMVLSLSNSDGLLTEQGSMNVLSSSVLHWMSTRNCVLSPDKWSCLGHFITLEIFHVISCSGLRDLPDVLLSFTSLKKLGLFSLKELETLPEWLGDLSFLEEIEIVNCHKLTLLPESMKKLSALQVLAVVRCESLEILPRELGQATSLLKIDIEGCGKLTRLPESIKNLTSLILLSLLKCRCLEMPEWLGELSSLVHLSIDDSRPNNFISSLKNMHNLMSLRILWLKCSDTILPEWVGQLVSLKMLLIYDCRKLTYLPESICNHTMLKEIFISGACLSLIEWCNGEGAGKINADVCPLPPYLRHIIESKFGSEKGREEGEEDEEEEEEQEEENATNWTKIFSILLLCSILLLSLLASMYNAQPLSSVGRSGQTKTSGRRSPWH